MPITVKDIIVGSLADSSKLNIHDRIISINGSEINDFLDLQFYSADEILKIIYSCFSDIFAIFSHDPFPLYAPVEYQCQQIG